MLDVRIFCQFFNQLVKKSKLSDPRYGAQLFYYHSVTIFGDVRGETISVPLPLLDSPRTKKKSKIIGILGFISRLPFSGSYGHP